MSIEMNMEARLGIQPEGNPSVSAVSCGSQYVSDRRGRSLEVRVATVSLNHRTKMACIVRPVTLNKVSP